MKSRLTVYIAVAMLAGPLCGLLLHHWLNGQQISHAANILALLTTAFLRLIKMIIAPLVFCTLTAGVARMDSGASIARVGARCLGWFIAATLVSMSIGLFLVQVFKPGLGIALPTLNGELPVAANFEIKDMLDHVIPDSIVQAMAKNEILQVVVFSLLFGTAAAALKPRTEALIQLLEQAASVVLRMTSYIMALAPIAVFAALAATVLTQGAGVLSTFAKFIAVFYLGLVILWLLFGLFLYLGIGRRMFALAKAVRAPLLLAFSTASSEAAYPQTLKSLEDFGVSSKIAAFVLPMGYSFNLDGAAMYCTFAMLFIAQIYRVDFTLQQQLLMVLILMITSKGVAGVPRVSLVIVAGSLAYFGLPEQGLVFIVAVDHLLDMGRTATNLIGNVVASCLVAKWEGELQESPS